MSCSKGCLLTVILTFDLVFWLRLKVMDKLFYCRFNWSCIAYSTKHKEGSQWRDWWVGVITASSWCCCWLSGFCYWFSETSQKSWISVELFKIRIHAEQSKILPNSRGQYGSPLSDLSFLSQEMHCREPCISWCCICSLWLTEENCSKMRKPVGRIEKVLDAHVCSAHLYILLQFRKESTD